MASQMRRSNEEIPYRFKISGNLIKKLGEESIANKNIAILELIKNSYDANATKVEIKLDNINTKSGNILVIDNGDGMTANDLENKWLNIATPNKNQKSYKHSERIPVGEKGLGRLSAQSLGDYTILETGSKNESAGYCIHFDWTKYQDPKVLLNEVVNSGYSFKKKKIESGTTLNISKLKHDWDDLEAQKSLLRDIYLIHPPNNRPKNFSITTSTFNVNELNRIDKAFLDQASYSMKVKLIAGKILKYKVKCITGKRQSGEVRLDKKLNCGEADFELFYYYRSQSYLKTALNISLSQEAIKKANAILDEYSGVKIFRDRFRVKPYGEMGNDWLNLDPNYHNNTMLPRNSNVFGFVHISKITNPDIQDTTTREGIVYNDAFQDLIRFIKTCIEKIFIDFRSEIESHKKKARKQAPTKKKTRQKTVAVAQPTAKTAAYEKLLKNLGGGYPQSFYLQLEQEINECYERNYPNATFFLCRKLIENLIFNILEKKYPSELGLWYNLRTNSHHKLSQLIRNLVQMKSDFKPNAQGYIEKFSTEIGNFRKEANAKAHNIFEYLTDRKELSKFKINDLTQLLLNIYYTV